MHQSVNNPDICKKKFNRVYDETFSEMRKYIAIKCSDITYVSDLLQELYIEYFKLLLRHGINYASNDRAILYKIANRKIYRYYSLKDKLKIFVPLHRTNEEGEDYNVADLTDSYFDSFEDKCVDKMESDRLWCILHSYPPDIKKIFYLFYAEDTPLREISEAMNLSLSCVKHKLYRTLEEIRKKASVP